MTVALFSQDSVKRMSSDVMLVLSLSVSFRALIPSCAQTQTHTHTKEERNLHQLGFVGGRRSLDQQLKPPESFILALHPPKYVKYNNIYIVYFSVNT